ncbi:MAG: CbiX/SirB N-terminal domain-containing protein, partial [Bdellovibrionota bacterium]|nr:CbiX/SirB N-terminal domain-containing protein [Bdellovibrionota bacterium]
MRKKIIFILVGHGSRNSETIKEFNTFQNKILEKIPHLNWAFGFLEYSGPSIEKVISKVVAENPEKIVLVPLFLFSSKHVKKDIPKVIQNFKYNNFVLLDSFKVNSPLINLLTQRVKESSGHKKKMRALVVVGRGA